MVEDGLPPYMIFGAILLYAAAHPALITKAGGDETQDTSKAEEHILTIRTDLPRRTEARELVIRPTVARFSPPPYFPKTSFFLSENRRIPRTMGRAGMEAIKKVGALPPNGRRSPPPISLIFRGRGPPFPRRANAVSAPTHPDRGRL